MFATFHKRLHSEEGGFTLIELMIVLVIIAILMLVAIPALMGYRARSQATVCKSNMKTLGTAEEAYYTDQNTYTTTLADLAQYVQGDFAVKSVCPTGAAAYTVAALTTIDKDYSISCSTADHTWTVETGATLK